MGRRRVSLTTAVTVALWTSAVLLAVFEIVTAFRSHLSTAGVPPN